MISISLCWSLARFPSMARSSWCYWRFLLHKKKYVAFKWVSCWAIIWRWPPARNHLSLKDLMTFDLHLHRWCKTKSRRSYHLITHFLSIVYQNSVIPFSKWLLSVVIFFSPSQMARLTAAHTNQTNKKRLKMCRKEMSVGYIRWLKMIARAKAEISGAKVY